MQESWHSKFSGFQSSAVERDLHWFQILCSISGWGCTTFWDHVVAWPLKMRQLHNLKQTNFQYRSVMSLKNGNFRSDTVIPTLTNGQLYIILVIHHYKTDFWEFDGWKPCLRRMAECISPCPDSLQTSVVQTLKKLFSLNSSTQPNITTLISLFLLSKWQKWICQTGTTYLAFYVASKTLAR